MQDQQRRFTTLEAHIDELAHDVLGKLPKTGIYGALIEFVVFGLKQGWACLFGGLLLGLIIVTRYAWPDALPITRYDFLFLAAISIQLAMLVFKLETWREAKVILIFHVVGTIMELFKTSVGSWTYPDAAFFQLGAVPLFSGFMYAAIGSYMARINRIFDIRLSNYPPLWATLVLAVAIYLNFFSHHFIYDFRYVLFAVSGLLFWRSGLHYRVHRFWHRMPLLIGFGLVTLFIWIAENIGTFTRTWLYPSQSETWTLVGYEKFGAWFLLMIISVVLVTLIHPPRAPDSTFSKD